MKPPIVVHLKAAPPRVRAYEEPTPPTHSQAPKERPNPLTVAHRWLGPRLVEKESGFWMDGGPVSLDGVMRATNRLLKAAGIEQLTTSERWRV